MFMIPDEYIKELFLNGNNLLREHLDPEETLPTQFFRGINPFHVDCMRHMTIFTEFNVIPKFCFSCYKVSIEPRTVMELFKIMVFFENLKLPDDNCRKCMVECRDHVSGAYKGLIYCSSIKEGEEIKKWAQQIISNEISNKIQVTLKRGCSEYGLSYPEYAQMSPIIKPMEYKEEWQQYEKIVDKDFNFQPQPTTFNHPSYNFNDAKVMLAWLRYAAAIGDESYLKISDESLIPLENVKRPSPFQPVEEL